MGIIICGFPGVGKTFLSENNNKYRILDIDSSRFKWVQGYNNERTDVEIKEFPNNYIEYILSKKDDADIILIGIQKEVREVLNNMKVDYHIVYPDISLKKEYFKRYEDRNDLPRFAINDIGLFEKIINNIEKENFPNLIKLKSGEFISDIIENILF